MNARLRKSLSGGRGATYYRPQVVDFTFSPGAESGRFRPWNPFLRNLLESRGVFNAEL
jgi:hypothetical protein